METKRTIGVSIAGVWLAFLCLVLGVPALFFSLSWVLLDVIAIATGSIGNLTGLGIIFSPATIGSAIVFLCGFASGILLLKRNPKGRWAAIGFLGLSAWFLYSAPLHLIFPWAWIFKPTVRMGIVAMNVFCLLILILPGVRKECTSQESFTARQKKWFIILVAGIAAVSFFKAVQGNMIWNAKIQKEAEDRQRRWEETDQKIYDYYDQFQKVKLVIWCDIRQNVQPDDLEARHAELRGLARTYIIDRLGPENISDYEFPPSGDSDIFLTGWVTREGYELLKQNKHAGNIYPDRIAMAFLTRKIVPVRVYFKIPKDRESSIQGNQSFAVNQIIHSLNPEDFTEYVFSKSKPDGSFYIRVTERGYHQLLNNEFVPYIGPVKE